MFNVKCSMSNVKAFRHFAHSYILLGGRLMLWVFFNVWGVGAWLRALSQTTGRGGASPPTLGRKRSGGLLSADY